MATSGEESVQGGKAALERCLKVLKTAKSDTETFAALLLITKLARAESMTSEDRNKIFKAVGFQFVNRLINTDSVPEDCDQDMFQSLALTLLACFSTDPVLAQHPDMLQKVPFLADVILLQRQYLSMTKLQEAMVNDAYDVMQAMALSDEGRKRLSLKVEPFVIAIKEQLFGHERSVSILSALLYHSSQELWIMQSDILNSLFNKLTSDFYQLQTAEKFTTCKLLTSLLSVSSTVPETMPDWTVRIHDALAVVLRNKLGEEQRDICLELSATMLHHYGTPWLLWQHQQDKKFFLLLVNLASIEVRLILETMDQKKQQRKAAVLCCCFSIIEQAVHLMVCESEVNLGQDEIYQLHGVLTAAFGAAIYHLKMVTVEQCNDPVVISCVRALFMWLAEETAQLKTDVIAILPFLINFCKMSLPKTPSLAGNSKAVDLPSNVFYLRLREDLVKLFLPGLCHLTAEKETRDAITHNEGMAVLVRYASDLFGREKSDAKIANDETSLVTLCNIFLNVILQDPAFVREHDEFGELLEILTSALKSEGDLGQSLELHCALVFAATLRVRPIVREVEQSTQDVVVRIGNLLSRALRCAPGQLGASGDVETLKNLICLLLQCLTECFTSHHWVATSLQKSQELKQTASNPPCSFWQRDVEVTSLLAQFQKQLSDVS